MPTHEPLGVPTGYLLEPASQDGVATWNLPDAELEAGRPYPILRSRGAIAAAADATDRRSHAPGR